MATKSRATTHGNYICKVGFYDIRQKTTCRPKDGTCRYSFGKSFTDQKSEKDGGKTCNRINKKGITIIGSALWKTEI